MMNGRSLFILVLLACCKVALAGDDAVVVTAVRDPVKKSYAKMLEGAKLFEERRHLAPAATLRFRLLPRKADAAPLKVAPPGENAQVMPNRKARTLAWRAEVRTPGLPPNVRRPGDLRLECEVGMASGLISSHRTSWLDRLFREGPDYCQRERPRYLFFAERPLFGVTLLDGERREVLSVDWLYAGATRDPQWKEDPPYCDCEALVDRAWYRSKESELVLLFEPSGTLAKTRLR